MRARVVGVSCVEECGADVVEEDRAQQRGLADEVAGAVALAEARVGVDARLARVLKPGALAGAQDVADFFDEVGDVVDEAAFGEVCVRLNEGILDLRFLICDLSRPPSALGYQLIRIANQKSQI